MDWRLLPPVNWLVLLLFSSWVIRYSDQSHTTRLLQTHALGHTHNIQSHAHYILLLFHESSKMSGLTFDDSTLAFFSGVSHTHTHKMCYVLVSKKLSMLGWISSLNVNYSRDFIQHYNNNCSLYFFVSSILLHFLAQFYCLIDIPVGDKVYHN